MHNPPTTVTSRAGFFMPLLAGKDYQPATCYALSDGKAHGHGPAWVGWDSRRKVVSRTQGPRRPCARQPPKLRAVDK